MLLFNVIVEIEDPICSKITPNFTSSSPWLETFYLNSYEKSIFKLKPSEKLSPYQQDKCTITLLLQKKETEKVQIWVTLDSDTDILQMDLADLEFIKDNIIEYRYIAFDPDYKDYPLTTIA